MRRAPRPHGARMRAACLALAVLLLPMPVAAQPLDLPVGLLRLRNVGPLPIVEIYAAPPGRPRGEDRLGADILPIGAEIEIEADGPECRLDVVAVFRDGREAVRRGADACAEEEIEFR